MLYPRKGKWTHPFHGCAWLPPDLNPSPEGCDEVQAQIEAPDPKARGHKVERKNALAIPLPPFSPFLAAASSSRLGP